MAGLYPIPDVPYSMSGLGTIRGHLRDGGPRFYRPDPRLLTPVLGGGRYRYLSALLGLAADLPDAAAPSGDTGLGISEPPQPVHINLEPSDILVEFPDIPRPVQRLNERVNVWNPGGLGKRVHNFFLWQVRGGLGFRGGRRPHRLLSHTHLDTRADAAPEPYDLVYREPTKNKWDRLPCNLDPQVKAVLVAESDAAGDVTSFDWNDLRNVDRFIEQVEDELAGAVTPCATVRFLSSDFARVVVTDKGNDTAEVEIDGENDSGATSGGLGAGCFVSGIIQVNNSSTSAITIDSTHDWTGRVILVAANGISGSFTSVDDVQWKGNRAAGVSSDEEYVLYPFESSMAHFNVHSTFIGPNLGSGSTPTVLAIRHTRADPAQTKARFYVDGNDGALKFICTAFNSTFCVAFCFRASPRYTSTTATFPSGS